MNPLVVAQVILAVALIAAILLQQRGTGLGGAFGGEVVRLSQPARHRARLFRLTIVLAVLFVLFSLLNLLPDRLSDDGPVGAPGACAIIGRLAGSHREAACRGGGIGRRARFRT